MLSTKGGGFFPQLFNTPCAKKKEEEIQKRTQELIEYFGLAKWKSYIVGNLPHGVQRLLGIAIAVALKPTLLMLDEPVTGMNPEETVETINLIKGLRDQGVSVLIVEHNMRAIMSACTKIVVLNAGVKIAEGLPEEIRNNEEVIKAYLGEKSNVFRG